MQKISYYLSQNRIQVVTDQVATGYITENRQVYQRVLKLYKGINNSVELEVKNAEQRRVAIVGKDIFIKFYDALHRCLFTTQAYPILSKLGIAEFIVSSDLIEDIVPQQLKMAIYMVDEFGRESILYADPQFGVLGGVELLDGYNEKYKVGDITETLTTFNLDYGRKMFVSEIAEFGTSINDDYSTTPFSSLTIDNIWVEIFNNPHAIYEGKVYVYATADKSLAIGSRWNKIHEIDLDSFDGSTLVTSHQIYKTVDGTVNSVEKDYKFIKFEWAKPQIGMNARFNIYREDGEYTATLAHGGSMYNIGDRILIPGSNLDGLNYINDVIITVTAVDSLYAKKTISGFTVDGIAVLGSGIYLSKFGENVTGTIDKINIRN